VNIFRTLYLSFNLQSFIWVCILYWFNQPRLLISKQTFSFSWCIYGLVNYIYFLFFYVPIPGSVLTCYNVTNVYILDHTGLIIPFLWTLNQTNYWLSTRLTLYNRDFQNQDQDQTQVKQFFYYALSLKPM